MSTLGNSIKLYRKRNHLSQTNLGRIIGVEASTISKYESGDREPDMETIKKIALSLGVSFEILVKHNIYSFFIFQCDQLPECFYGLLQQNPIL